MIFSVSSFKSGITPQTTQKPFLSSSRNQSYRLKEDCFSPRRCGDEGPWELPPSLPIHFHDGVGGFGFGFWCRCRH